MTNIVVAQQRTIRVSTNATSGIINTSVPVTLKNNPTIYSGNGASSIDTLNDVNITNRTDGSTLVYDSSTNTYLVQPLNFSDLSGTFTGDIDSGTF